MHLIKIELTLRIRIIITLQIGHQHKNLIFLTVHAEKCLTGLMNTAWINGYIIIFHSQVHYMFSTSENYRNIDKDKYRSDVN